MSSSVATFREKLDWGKIGEKLVERFLQKECGMFVVPSYDFNANDKAPRPHGESGSFVIPDLDCSKSGVRVWVEVKTYSTSPVNRKLGEKTHGIKRRLYEQYKSVEKITGSDVFLFVLEVDTGHLLKAKLSELVPHECQCGACRAGNPEYCFAPVRDSVYFRRSEFVRVHTFSAEDLSTLRQRPGWQAWGAEVGKFN